MTGEALVRVRAVGLCGSDLAHLTDRSAPGVRCSWRPGHEIIGERVDGGPVAVNPLIACGACALCADGDIHLCARLLRLGWDLPGGFAEYLAVPTSNLVPLPEHVDKACAVLADPLAVAIHGIRCGLGGFDTADLAIIGSGAVAVCSAFWAADGNRRVRLYVRDVRRLGVMAELLAEIGVVISTPGQAVPAAHDAVIDAARGADSTPLRLALDLVRDGGAVLVQNAYATGVGLDRDLRDVFRRSLTLIGSFSFCRRDGDDFLAATTALAAEPTWAREVSKHRWPLAELDAVVGTMCAPDPARPAKAVLLC